LPQLVQKTINLALSEDFVARHRATPTAFTRQRKLTFFNLLLFLLNQVKGSLQEELDAFLREGDQLQAEPVTVTKAAFSKARRYLKPSAFIELNQRLLANLEAQHPLATWQGLRVLAVDGSKISVPDAPAVIAHFGGQGNAYADKPMALISQCYDVLNELSLDVEVQPYNTSERTMARAHLERLSGNHLFLYDRGYAATWLMALHQDRQQHFCMRMKTAGGYRCVKDFLASEAVDACVELKISRADRKKHDLVHEALTVRLIKVVLPTGEIEVLATNLLDTARYPHEQFQPLYHLRWGVEEDYKQQKHSLKIELYSGKTVHAVLQDIHAKVLTKNLTSVIALGATEGLATVNARRKRTYQLNFKQALSNTKFTLIKIVKAARPAVWVERLVRQMLRYLEMVRPGRQFPRKRSVGTRGAVSGTYKPIR
jgi:hypothetical protein